MAALTPVLLVDAATAGKDTTDIAVTAVLACLLVAVVVIPGLLFLHSFRKRGLRRRQLLRQWAAVDRGHDSEFPRDYGAPGYPHPRFFNAALVLSAALLLTVAVLAGLSEPKDLAMLPGLVVAALFAWAVIRKYADRYGWASRELGARARAYRRHQQRSRLAGTQPVQQVGVHPALLGIALCTPAIVVTLVYVVARPENVLGLAVAGAVAVLVLVLGLPKSVLRKRRERMALAEVADRLAPSFGAGAVVRPIRYGLGEAAPQDAVAGRSASWEQGPPRAGALAVDAGALHLRGEDGTHLELPLTEIVGVTLIPNSVAWLDPSIDFLVASGEAIEVRSVDAKEIAEEISAAGVSVSTVSG